MKGSLVESKGSLRMPRTRGAVKESLEEKSERIEVANGNPALR